jgi:pyruvate dehydrogenase E1 component
MYVKGEDVYYYITIYNENYPQAPKPEGIDEGLLRGIYRFAAAPAAGKGAKAARLIGSGSILQQVIEAQKILAERFGVVAEVYSAPSFPLLRREALAIDRWNRLHPASKARVPYVTEVLGPKGGPIVAATDWLKTIPQLVAPWVPATYLALGTDGFGRSDTRESLRAFFEIDAANIAAATMVALARDGEVTAKQAAAAIKDLGIDPDKVDPAAV